MGTQKLLRTLVVLLLTVTVFKSYSTTYYSRVVTGLWSAASSWSQSPCGGVQPADGAVPGVGDDIVICSGNTITMDGNSGSCLSLTINGVATWTSAFTTNVGTGGVTISSTGNITSSAIGVLTTAGGLVVNATLTSTQVVITTQTTSGQTISGTGSIPVLTVNTPTTNNGTLTVRTTFSGSSTLTQGATGILNYLGTTAIVPTINASTVGNTFNYSGTSTQIIKSTTYYNLTVSGAGVSTLAGAISVNNNLLLSGGTLDCSIFQITGNITGVLTLSASTILILGATASAAIVDFPTLFTTGHITLSSSSRVTYQGNYAQVISTVPTTYGNVTISTGAATVSKTLSAASNVAIAGSLTLTNGMGIVTLNMGAQSLTVAGSVTGTGNLSLTSGNFTITGSYTSTGTLTPGSGTTLYNGTNQTVKSTTYNHLTFTGSGTKTMGGAITVNGNLSINASGSILSTGQFQLTGNATGTFTMASGAGLLIGSIGSAVNVLFPTNFTALNTTFSGTSTVTYQGNSAQTISSVPTYRNLTINTFNGSKVSDGNISVLGNMVVTSPCTFSMTTFTLNLTGTFTSTGGLSFTSGNFNMAGSYTNSGAFTCGTGSVDYTSTGTQTVKGTTYYNLTISQIGTSNLGGAVTVNNNLSITGGTLATGIYQITGNATGALILASGTTLTLAGTLASSTNFPTLYTNITLDVNSIVNYSSTGAQTIKALDYGTLNISGARTTASVTLEPGTIGIRANSTTCFDPTATFTSGAYIIAGNTIEFEGTGAQTIRTFTNGGYNNLTSSGIGARTFLNGGTISVAGAFTPGTNTYTITNSTVNYNGSSPQTITAFTYNNLTVAGSAAKTLGGAIVVNNNLTISSNLDVSASNYSITLKRHWINNGTFTPQNGTVTLNGTLAQTMSGSGTSTFANLIISNTAGVSITSGTYTLSDVLTLSNGTFASGGNSFTLLSSATKTARIAQVTGTGAMSGNFIIERHIPSRGSVTWTTMCAPVASTTFADWDNELFFYYPHSPYAAPYSYSNVVKYSETVGDFIGVTAATTLVAGEGLEIFLADDGTLTGFSNTTLSSIGVPNTGTENISLSYTASPYPGDNLVGNPFASSIQVNGMTFTNALTGVDVYDNITDNYITLSGTDELAPHQGFWAYATSAGASVSVPETAKTTSSTGTIKCFEKNNYMRLTIASADGSHTMAQTLSIAADNEALDGWDPKDHPYRKSPKKTAPFIISNSDKRPLSINTFSSNHTEYHMSLKSGVGIAGNYQITIKGVETINPSYTMVILEDKTLGKMIDLNKAASYTFYASPVDNQNRFVLHFYGGIQTSNSSANITNATSIESIAQVLQTQNGTTLNFNSSENLNVTITATNLLGQNIIAPIALEANTQSVEVTIPSDFHGIYLIKISSEKGEMVRKMVKP